jgi:hypothetical protein
VSTLDYMAAFVLFDPATPGVLRDRRAAVIKVSHQRRAFAWVAAASGLIAR